MHKLHKINTKYKNLLKINKSPPIYVCDQFLSNKECDYMINENKNKMKHSTVVKLVNGKEQLVEDSHRNSESCHLSNSEYNFLIKKISRLINKDSRYFEGLQVGHYTKGGFYKSHHDALDIHTKLGKSFVQTRGQRIITVLIYLNDVEKGGRTYFNNLDIRIKPRKGMALVFFPAFLDREIDERTLHTAEDVVDEKWVTQLWVRDVIQ